jgi:CHAT domain-containing protein/Tfp pilus assembly protein PilF
MVMRLGSAALATFLASVVVAMSTAFATIATPVPIALDEIRFTIDHGDYVDAERRARTLLEDLDASVSGETIEAARALDLLVESLQRQERGYSAEVREMAERSLAIKRRFLPAGDPDLAPTLANLARVRYQVDLDLAGALALSAEAVRIAVRSFGSEDVRRARYWTARAAVLLEAGRVEATRQALENAQAGLGPESPATLRADTLYAYGRLEYMASDFEAAVARAEDGLVHTESDLGPDHPETARMLGLLALALIEDDRLDDAEVAADRCVAIADLHYGAPHPLAGRCIRMQAKIARERGLIRRARGLSEEALDNIERSCGPEHPELLGPLNEYGALLSWVWDLQAGKAALERSIEIAERYHGGSDHRIGWLLNSYGNLLRKMGDGAAAERAFERAVEIGEASEEPNPLQWSTAVINLAYLKQVGGDLETARRLYSEAIPVFENVPAVNATWRSELKQIYGGLLCRMGEHAEGRRLHEEAVEIRRRVLGPEHYKVAKTLGSYALCMERSGDVAGAYGLRRQALEILERTFGPDGAEVGLELRRIARNRFRAGQGAEAFGAASRAERIRARNLRLTVAALTERHALAYVDSWPSVQSLLLTMAIDAAGDANPDPRAAWEVIVPSRALVVDELAARHRSLADAGVPADLVAELTDARERLANLVVRGAADSYAARFGEALRAKEHAEERVAAISADFRRLRAKAAIGLAEVEAALPRDAALVAFVRYAHHERPADADASTANYTGMSPHRFRKTPSYAAFVLPAGREAPRIVGLGPAEPIEAAVDAWLAEVASPPGAVRTLATDSARRYREAGWALRRQIWDPLAELVAGASRVLVVPDGALNAVSFATLPAGAERYLLEDGAELHYVSAERDVVPLESGSSGHRLLAVGGPDFDAAPKLPDVERVAGDSPLRASLEHRSASVRFRGARPSCEDFRSIDFRNLPGASGEVDEISAIWTDASPEVVVLEGDLAHEAWVKALASEHDTLHLATHGFYLGAGCDGGDATSPAHPLLYSGLALAGANNRGTAGAEDEDGILTAEEVASLDLTRAGWVVLSGCETGRGHVLSGEGVLGLRRAFRVAGARTLIMSLWPVEDDATRRWMRALYRARADGATTSRSVRDAALHVLEENRRLGLPDHPFYWGAFVAAGDWR